MGDDQPRRRSQDVVQDNPLFAVIMENQNRLEGKIDAAATTQTSMMLELATRITQVEGKLDHRASVHHDLANTVQRISGKTDVNTTEIARLQVKSALWGGVTGMIPGAIFALVTYIGAPGA